MAKGMAPELPVRVSITAFQGANYTEGNCRYSCIGLPSFLLTELSQADATNPFARLDIDDYGDFFSGSYVFCHV
jgi:hypothetical protein